MVNWDKFRETVRGSHSDLFEFQQVTIYNFEGGYDPESGEADAWTEDAGTQVEAEAIVPTTSRLVTGPEGQELTVDRIFRVRDDAPVEIVAVGQSNRRPTEIEVDDNRFVVTTKTSEGNGLLQMLGVET